MHSVTVTESGHLKTYYRATRFTTGKDTWPPEQPKHFTPVVLICQEGQRTMKETEAMAAATSKGGIEQYLSTTTRKITKDLLEVFSQLEQPPAADSQLQRSILVEGSPGVGKSILLKHIAYLWAKGELLTSIEFLFLLHLRDPSVQQMDSLHSLVCHFYHYDKQASQVTSYVAQDSGESVAILLDGYDELPPGLRENSFIDGLLQRKILPACVIVVSSRPHASVHLHDNFNCQVEILGFSEQDQQLFIEHSLKDQPHKISELKQYLKNHSTISNLCFIPFNITILLFLYKNKEERPLPTNPTGLYNLFICLTICRHLAKSGIILNEEIKDLNSFPQPYSNIINQLSKFAFRALGSNQLVFNLAEIKKECPDIDKTSNGFGLLQAVEHVGRTSKFLSFNFIHLSMQEFLAAHHVATLSLSEELFILQKNFWNNASYFNMFDIYVALTKGQRPSFKQFLQPSLMEKVISFFTGRGRDSFGISQQLLCDKIKCLRIYYCFQEAGDVAMCKSIENASKLHKQNIILMGINLTPSDVECLAVFLSCSSHKEWELLHLDSCHIQNYGLQILQCGMRNSYITITALVLTNNDLTAISASAINDLTIRCRVKQLFIAHNKAIGEDGRLYRIISDHSSMVEELYIHNTELSSTATIELFTALSEGKKLKLLSINNNSVTDEACDAITLALKKNTSLTKLFMHFNPISGECAQCIAQACQHNNTLQLLNLNDDCPDDVKVKIRSMQEKLNEERRIHGCEVKLEITFDRIHFIHNSVIENGS